MGYQVLARRWRPQTFANIVGQEYVLIALMNGSSSGRIYHAYLFFGTRGVGKTSIIRLLTGGLNHETDITTTPCDMCDDCREIEQGRFVDLIETDAASRIRVEGTHDLLDSVQYASARGRLKAYLIDEVYTLSRHSFNTLLKALGEPPEHVKFLLVTTGLQKLLMAILSRCLRFHLKTLGVEQTRHQFEHILNEEHAAHELRALRLLARAVEGSLRDALSLVDQAIANDDGQVSAQAVNVMLGMLDDDRTLSLVETMVEASNERVMTLINEAAARGIEQEALLVEMLDLLHYIVMIRLSLAALGNNMAAIELRMHELARIVPPTDIQLYHQTLLIGRKELPYAPDRHVGIEITLLYVLTFHPHMPPPEPEVPRQSFAPTMPTAVMTLAQVPPQPQSAPQQASTIPLLGTTSRVLAMRQQLQRVQGATKVKRSEPAAVTRARSVNSAALERLASTTDRVQACPVPPALEKAPAKREAYRREATTPMVQQKEVAATSKVLKKALEHEKTPELAARLAAKAIEHDPWVVRASQLSLSKLVEQAASNAWKEEDGNAVCLHPRSSRRCLNNRGVRQKLAEALSMLKGSTVELTIVEDDNSAVRTSLKWRQAIYEERFAQARGPIIANNNIQALRRLSDVELDEESIRPI